MVKTFKTRLINAYQAMRAFWHVNSPFRPRDKMRMTGRIDMKLMGPDGRVKDVRTVKNLIVDDGFDFVCDAIANTARSAAVMDDIAIGTDNTAADATDTALGTEVSRKAATYSHTGGTKVFTLQVTFDPGEGTGSIVESGVFDQATIGGTMLNRKTFGVITKAAGDSLQVTWTFTLS